MNICSTWPDTWSITNRGVRVVLWKQPDPQINQAHWRIYGPRPRFETKYVFDADMLDAIADALAMIDTVIAEYGEDYFKETP